MNANPVTLFQFPSNGKAYLNAIAVVSTGCSRIQVSIPFKRESISEPHGFANEHTDLLEFGFNSLQTGKYI